MKRLTSKKEADTLRDNYNKLLAAGMSRDISVERFLKLYEYENTGLEPQEIEELKKKSSRKKDCRYT